jgi:hypothetical protein
MRIVQGYLFRSEGPFEYRSDTVCKIIARVTDADGELLGDGPAFWVTFGDAPEKKYFAYGHELSPWFPID